ncbi:hypothetical protein HPB48_002529 [Haemaphysalis longicornis]|uniref:Ion transport domain-containing protein n=1 Tax=Haemaphysalis longicornis TaxID=44386 RepID=A0A9J6GPK6_HAELO|nr:hypothetical protein HPB48_002529 [Haemaphysalis longicornis]
MYYVLLANLVILSGELGFVSKTYPCVFVADSFADLVYLLDIVVQFRTGYLEQGLMVCEARKLAGHYVRSKPFLMDLLALTPLDLLQFQIGIAPLLRFPRFIKVYRCYRFYYMVESRTIYPNLWRVVNLIHILLLLSHWFGCFYYMLSEFENYDGDWTYHKPDSPEWKALGRKYLASLYWSTLTLTTIGDLVTPSSNLQYAPFSFLPQAACTCVCIRSIEF